MRLRGHHLICLHFFKGLGYSEEFKKNLEEILSKISNVLIVDGLDDVCKACPYNVGKCNYSENAEEEVKELDEFALKKLGLKVGEVVNWFDLKKKIPEVIEDWKDFACKGCNWREVCDL